MKKYFDLEAESLKDYLKREEFWTKQKKEEEEHRTKLKKVRHVLCPEQF